MSSVSRGLGDQGVRETCGWTGARKRLELAAVGDDDFGTGLAVMAAVALHLTDDV